MGSFYHDSASALIVLLSCTQVTQLTQQQSQNKEHSDNKQLET